VESVSANLGQIVKKGQVLAVLASPALSEQRSELMAAQKRLSFARTTYEREKKLWEEKILRRAGLPAGSTGAARGRNCRCQRAAEAHRHWCQCGCGWQANRYVLRAPFDGMIVEKHIALGEAVKEDGQVFTISDLSTVWAEISVPAKDLARVRVGEKVTIRPRPSTPRRPAPWPMWARSSASRPVRHGLGCSSRIPQEAGVLASSSTWK
jgi:cobalt-zinc-cadmium efflux system membrane fusion protein